MGIQSSAAAAGDTAQREIPTGRRDLIGSVDWLGAAEMFEQSKVKRARYIVSTMYPILGGLQKSVLRVAQAPPLLLARQKLKVTNQIRGYK